MNPKKQNKKAQKPALHNQQLKFTIWNKVTNPTK